MSSPEVVLTCPLGATCEEIKDNKIHRCRWYQTIEGVDAQGNPQNKSDCAIAILPLIGLEFANQVRSTASAIEGHRNAIAENNFRKQLTSK